MQSPVNAPPGSYPPPRPKSKANVPLIVALTSCGCLFLLIPILAAILFPVFAQARAKARQTTCLSNEKQMALGVLMYVQDYDETFPSTKEWMMKIEPYVKNPEIYHCPAARNANEGDDGRSNYGYAYHALMGKAHLDDFAQPEGIVLLYDSSTLTPSASDELTSLPVPGRHSTWNNFSFMDGHARSMSSELFGALLQSVPQQKLKPTQKGKR